MTPHLMALAEHHWLLSMVHFLQEVQMRGSGIFQEVMHQG
jgi:hypothetical protein